MMGDFEDAGDDLVDTDSFINHRGAGEEPYYVPTDTDSDSSFDLNDLDLDWSHADLRGIMDELELVDDYSDDGQMENDFLGWNAPGEDLGIFELGEENEDREDQVEWYGHPYESNFVQDFSCLQTSNRNIRKDLLDMLEIPERASDYGSDAGVGEDSINEEVLEAINDILTPGMSREGLRQLHKIVLREPTLNLKKYLEDADPYTLAYIIWGLNFYINRHAKDEWKNNLPRIVECGTQSSSVDLLHKEGNHGFPNMIYTLGIKLLSWICGIIKEIKITGYEDIVRLIFPHIGGMKTDNEVEFIR